MVQKQVADNDKLPFWQSGKCENVPALKLNFTSWIYLSAPFQATGISVPSRKGPGYLIPLAVPPQIPEKVPVPTAHIQDVWFRRQVGQEIQGCFGAGRRPGSLPGKL